MIPVIIPVCIAVMTGAVCFKKRTKNPVMTPEREKVYNAAINGALKDPEKLRALSDVFAGEGYIPQAKLLRQRAKLRELPQTVQVARRNVFRRALASKNKTAVLHVAQAYETEGCTGAAKRLRDYASGLP